MPWALIDGTFPSGLLLDSSLELPRLPVGSDGKTNGGAVIAQLSQLELDDKLVQHY